MFFILFYVFLFCSLILRLQPLSLLPSHTTLHTPFTQMFRELLFMKQGVPSVTASSIFSEKNSFTGRQCSSHGTTGETWRNIGLVFSLAASSGWTCSYSYRHIIFRGYCHLRFSHGGGWKWTRMKRLRENNSLDGLTPGCVLFLRKFMVDIYFLSKIANNYLNWKLLLLLCYHYVHPLWHP